MRMNQQDAKEEDQHDQEHTLQNITVVIKIPKKRGRKPKVRNPVKVLNVEQVVSFT